MTQSLPQFKKNLPSFSLTVVIPCLNEHESIPWVLQRLVELSSNAQFLSIVSDLQIVVVDDGSADGGLELVQSIAMQYPFIKSLSNPANRGYGGAIKAGLNSANSDLYCFLDMDETYDPFDLIPMLESMIENNLDMIYGARLHQGSQMPNLRNFGNQLYAFLVRIFYGTPLSDVCTGLRIFRQELRTEILGISEDGLNFSIALTMKSILLRWKISEVQISYNDRKGYSKLSILRDGFNFLFVIFNSLLLRSR